jgi:D-3-phosphoglycerate dehydrogenase
LGFFLNQKSKRIMVRKTLGLKQINHGSLFLVERQEGNDCSTQWSPFVADTNYFEPSEKQFIKTSEWMISSSFLKNYSDEGVTIIGDAVL